MTSHKDDAARIEIRCSAEEKARMRTVAARAGYPGRGFQAWARARLLGEDPHANRPAPNIEVLSAQQAADYCGVTRQQVYVWLEKEKGTIRRWELPEGLRIAKEDLRPHLRQSA